jgi:hypothetical protein
VIFSLNGFKDYTEKRSELKISERFLSFVIIS